MNRLGINVDWGHGFPASDVIGLGVSWFRFPWSPRRSDRAVCKVLRAAGLEPVPVMDKTSFAGFDDPRAAVARLLEDLGDLIERVQLLNEPDSAYEEGRPLEERARLSPSSWVMEPDGVDWWLRRCGPVVRDAGKLVVGPGLCSGQPSWARQLDLSLLDELGVHLYVGDGVEYTLQLYAELGLPLRVTEYHARWHGLGARALRVADAAAFCLSDRMVVGFGVLEDPQALAELRGLSGLAAPNEHTSDLVGPGGAWIGRGLGELLKAEGWHPESGEEWLSLKGVRAKEGCVFWSDREGKAFKVKGLRL